MQLPPVSELRHVSLVLRLLEELVTAPGLTRPPLPTSTNDDEEDWVVLRESGEETRELRRQEPGIQSLDDLELLFAQVPLQSVTEFALRQLREDEGLQTGVQVRKMSAGCLFLTVVFLLKAVRLLLEGAKRFSVYDHFARLLGNSALRLVQCWARACHGAQSDALSRKCFAELIKVWFRVLRFFVFESTQKGSVNVVFSARHSVCAMFSGVRCGHV